MTEQEAIYRLNILTEDLTLGMLSKRVKLLALRKTLIHIL